MADDTLARMFWSRVDGSGEPAVLTKSEVLQFPTSFSPDGRYLVGFDYARANIVLIDTASGAIQLIPSKGMGNASWQRLPLP